MLKSQKSICKMPVLCIQYWSKNYCPKPHKDWKFSFLVRKIHAWQNNVIVFNLKVIQGIMNNWRKFQCISMSITEVIKGTKLPKITSVILIQIHWNWVLKVQNYQKLSFFSSITCHKKCLRQHQEITWPWNFAKISLDKFCKLVPNFVKKY